MIVDEVPRLVGALQVSDRRYEQDSQPYVPMSGRYLPGDGELPLVEILRPVLDARPDLAVGIEVANDALTEMSPADAAAVAAASVRNLIASITA